jgi:phosphate transport system substrate-binding protein
MNRLSVERMCIGALLAFAALLGTVIPTSGLAAAGTTLKIGSTPVILPIAQATQAAFQQAFPDTTLSISTQQAKQNVLNSVNDVGLAHSDLQPCQADGDTGDDCKTTYKVNQLNDTVFGRDAIAIIANTGQSGVTQITKDQIKGIYEGTITNWSQLSGPDQPLVPRAMNTGGTGYYGPLQDSVGLNSNREAGAISATGLARLASSANMVSAVAGDPRQIGYVGIGYVASDPDVKVLAVATKAGGPYVAPSNQTVSDGSYPMFLNLHVLSLKDGVAPNLNPRRLDYANFLTGKEAQQQAAANHFVPFTQAAASPAPQPTVVAAAPTVAALAPTPSVQAQSAAAQPSVPQTPQGATAGCQPSQWQIVGAVAGVVVVAGVVAFALRRR